MPYIALPLPCLALRDLDLVDAVQSDLWPEDLERASHEKRIWHHAVAVSWWGVSAYLFEWAVGSNIVGFVGFLVIGCPGLGHSREVACRQKKEGKSQALTIYLSRNGIPLACPLWAGTVIDVLGTWRPTGRTEPRKMRHLSDNGRLTLGAMLGATLKAAQSRKERGQLAGCVIVEGSGDGWWGERGGGGVGGVVLLTTEY